MTDDRTVPRAPRPDETRRAQHRALMERHCDPDAGATTIYGIALDDMNDEEIRVAALWFATVFGRAKRNRLDRL